MSTEAEAKRDAAPASGQAATKESKDGKEPDAPFVLDWSKAIPFESLSSTEQDKLAEMLKRVLSEMSVEDEEGKDRGSAAPATASGASSASSGSASAASGDAGAAAAASEHKSSLS